MINDSIKDNLIKYQQDKLLAYLTEPGICKANECKIAKQLSSVDWSFLEPHKSYSSVDEIEPIEVMFTNAIRDNQDDYETAGIEAIRAGKLALVLLAGGQGTRLGYEHPKGMFNVGINRDLYIFECLINNTMQVVEKAGCFIPFYIKHKTIFIIINTKNFINIFPINNSCLNRVSLYPYFMNFINFFFVWFTLINKSCS